MKYDWTPIVSILAGLSLLLALLYGIYSSRQQCYEVMKERPSAEIKVVCG